MFETLEEKGLFLVLLAFSKGILVSKRRRGMVRLRKNRLGSEEKVV